MMSLNNITVGDVVRLIEPLYPYVSCSPDLGLVVEWMEPFAKTMEPYGIFRILWSGEMEHLNHSDDISDDIWLSAEDLEIVFKGPQISSLETLYKNMGILSSKQNKCSE